MFSYITSELPSLLEGLEGFDTANCAIMGHSMGGHGALIIALKQRGTYKVRKPLEEVHYAERAL